MHHCTSALCTMCYDIASYEWKDTISVGRRRSWSCISLRSGDRTGCSIDRCKERRCRRWPMPCLLIMAKLALWVGGGSWVPEIECAGHFSHRPTYRISLLFPMSIGTFETQFALRRFWGWRSLPGCTNIRSICRHNTSFCSEVNRKHADGGFVSIHLTVFEILTSKFRKMSISRKFHLWQLKTSIDQWLKNTNREYSSRAVRCFLPLSSTTVNF